MFNSKPRDYLYECAKSGRRYITGAAKRTRPRQRIYRKTLGNLDASISSGENQVAGASNIHGRECIITFPVAATAGSPFARCADACPFVFPFDGPSVLLQLATRWRERARPSGSAGSGWNECRGSAGRVEKRRWVRSINHPHLVNEHSPSRRAR